MKIRSLFRITIFIALLGNVFVVGQLNPIRVACIGNSITAGAGETADKSYPVQLGKLLGSRYEVKNYGISARTLLRKGDFPYWKEQYLVQAVEYEPQIVIIKLGTNDTKPQNWIYKNEFFTDYVDLINEFRKSSVKPQIFISYPCPVFMTNWGIRDSILKLEIPIIDSIRKFTHTDLIDFNTPLLDSSALFPDGVHPNARGYLVMAQIVKSAIIDSSSGRIRTFNSDKRSFDKNEQVKLYWETSPGSEVTLNGNVVKETDSLKVNPTQTTAYLLIAKGKNHSDTITCTLQFLPPGKIKSFYAKPRMLELGANDSTKIFWTTASGSQAFFDQLPVEAIGMKIVSPASTQFYKLTTTGDTSDAKEISIQVLPAEQLNRALDGIVKSSTAAKYFPAVNAVDGDTSTCWKSRNESSPWVYLDFEKVVEFKRVILHWGKNYAKAYRLQAVSESGALTTIYTQNNGGGGVEEVSGLSGSGRYLRLLCTVKAIADSGYMLNEFEIYLQKKNTAIEQTANADYDFQLFQNFPNPFNPQTTISYQLKEKSFVTLKIFDLLGNEVATLVNESKNAGSYTEEFNFIKGAGRENSNGINAKRSYASGVYFYQLSATAGGKNFIQTKKMIALK